jgi:hypothetical protein
MNKYLIIFLFVVIAVNGVFAQPVPTNDDQQQKNQQLSETPPQPAVNEEEEEEAENPGQGIPTPPQPQDGLVVWAL